MPSCFPNINGEVSAQVCILKLISLFAILWRKCAKKLGKFSAESYLWNVDEIYQT